MNLIISRENEIKTGEKMKNLTRPNYFIIKSFSEHKKRRKKRNKNKKRKKSKREMLLLCWLVGYKIKTKE